RLAPSSSNRQAWHFIVVDDQELKDLIPEHLPMGSKRLITWLNRAPVVIVGLYFKAVTHYLGELFGHENYLIDFSIAMTHMALTATELGIGTCFVGWFNEKYLKKLLKIPNQYRIGSMLVMGYPETASNEQGIGGIKPRPRKKLEEIVSYNRFGKGLVFKK
ncbi:hypothetical protein A2Y85_04325, partial [candidate division WOR-3 bacterium RBG_13_43_14]